jgi:hypothetical protein
MAVAVAAAAEAGAVGAVPRDYNFAADVLQKNLDAGRAGKPANSPTGWRASAPR